ncbi:cupin-like domain-containing protein [Maricaulis parjimensis]|uniref:cupin-like domain-containing protein n=1 Tax=Maricaulis parjimensis TaxID=144023 RepID=UPI001939E203|nr:cupin-like domain-containing protein [Maricaulis parjimensis]
MADASFEGLAPVREWTGVDRARFEADIQPLGAPAVMRGLVADWPLVQSGEPSALCGQLKSSAADLPVRPFQLEHEKGNRFFYGPDLQSFNFETCEMTLGEMLDALLDRIDREGADALYAGAVPVRDALAGIADTHVMPLLDSGVERLTSLWIGNRTRTAPHWDLPQNIACVISGRRRFLLFPIEQVENLYIGPLDFTLAGQPISLVDPQAPDLACFPRYAEALKHAQTVVLEPGDALYLPSLHVHYVESLDPFGVMMNFWWRDGPEHLVTPFLTLLHGLLTLRGLPAAERQSWKVLFERYLFQDEEDPMAHLPDDARGMFGKADAERLARIKMTVGRALNR